MNCHEIPKEVLQLLPRELWRKVNFYISQYQLKDKLKYPEKLSEPDIHFTLTTNHVIAQYWCGEYCGHTLHYLSHSFEKYSEVEYDTDNDYSEPGWYRFYIGYGNQTPEPEMERDSSYGYDYAIEHDKTHWKKIGHKWEKILNEPPPLEPLGPLVYFDFGNPIGYFT